MTPEGEQRYLRDDRRGDLHHPDVPLLRRRLDGSDVIRLADQASRRTGRVSRPLALHDGNRGGAAGLYIRVRVYKVNNLSVGSRRRTESVIRLTAGGRPGLFTCTSRDGLVAGTAGFWCPSSWAGGASPSFSPPVMALSPSSTAAGCQAGLGK